jgi:hypothetical protein
VFKQPREQAVLVVGLFLLCLVIGRGRGRALGALVLRLVVVVPCRRRLRGAAAVRSRAAGGGGCETRAGVRGLPGLRGGRREPCVEIQGVDSLRDAASVVPSDLVQQSRLLLRPCVQYVR